MKFLIILFTLLFSLSSVCSADDRQSTIRPLAKAKKKVKRNVFATLEKIPFEKEKELSGEHFEFSSPLAESIWRFLQSKKELRLANVRPEKFLPGRIFLDLGKKTYLVHLENLYLVELEKNRVRQLAEWWKDVEIEDFRKIDDKRFWALAHNIGLRRGIFSYSYYTINIKHNENSAPHVSVTKLLSGMESDDGMCGVDLEVGSVATHINEMSIKDVNSDKLEDLVFNLKQQDCKTKEIVLFERVFVNSGNGFIEKKPQ